jgi:hypothetical protein
MMVVLERTRVAQNQRDSPAFAFFSPASGAVGGGASVGRPVPPDSGMVSVADPGVGMSLRLAVSPRILAERILRRASRTKKLGVPEGAGEAPRGAKAREVE